MTIKEQIEIGDRLDCFWGQWRVNVRVSKVTKNKTIYAQRWIKSGKRWSAPKQVEEYKGMWRRL